MALTERQQEIRDLQTQGKQASEIAAQLGITTNAVYQQIRRMRGGKGKAAPKAGPKSAAKAAPKTEPKATATEQPKATPAKAAPAPRVMTPLQSIRARRDELMAEIKGAEGDRDAAQKVLQKAEEALAKINAKHDAELATLEAAEAALQGKLTLSAPVEAEAESEVAEAPVAEAPVAPEEPVAQPEAPAEAPKPASTRSRGRSGAKRADEGTQVRAEAARAAGQPDQPSDEEPKTTQAEREASADFEPEVAAQEAATDPEPVAA